MQKISKKKTVVTILIIVLLTAGVAGAFYFNSEAFFNKQLTYPGKYLNVNLPDSTVTTTNGKLYGTEEGLMVMDLNGTSAEMGYAHGAILGNQIKYTVEYAVASSSKLSLYNDYHDNVLPQYLAMDETNYKTEIEAIVSGAVESGADMYVNSLERDWDAMDLYMLNTIPDWCNLGCSGVGVWGESSADGLTFIGRNMEFIMDRNGYISQLYTMIIYRGDGERNTVISFGFPGYIGVLTGFNTDGVWVQIDLSNGAAVSKTDRTGICFANRKFLETNDGTDIEENSQQFYLDCNLTSSALLMIGSNNAYDDGSSPVFVLEVRDDIVGYRGEENQSDDFVVLTNHERVNQEAVACTRYTRYLSDMEGFKTTYDYKIDTDELLRMQQHNGGNLTINCIQFYPSTLKFRVGYTRVDSVVYGQKWDETDIIGGPYDNLLETWYSWSMFK